MQLPIVTSQVQIHVHQGVLASLYIMLASEYYYHVMKNIILYYVDRNKFSEEVTFSFRSVPFERRLLLHVRRSVSRFARECNYLLGVFC